MEIKEKNFFKKVWTSIRDFEGYEEFAAGKVTKAIKYLLLLTLIFASIISLIYTYKFYSIIQEVKSYVSENVEEISLIDGKLNIKSEEKIEIINENSIVQAIIVDTSENANKNEYIEKIKPYNTGIIFLSDKMVVVSDLLTREGNIEYQKLIDTNIEGKEEFLQILDIKGFIGSYVVFFITMVIYVFTIYAISNLVDSVILGALGYFFSRIIKLRLKFKATYNIGAHALTLPIILSLIYVIINTLTGFEIKYFQWMYTSISYIYVVVAILMIKAEIINQKIQLLKLQEIQDQVSKEAEEETIGKKEEDKEENKEEEKQDKAPSDEENPGEEPESSNA